jgi:hypothetical protein
MEALFVTRALVRVPTMLVVLGESFTAYGGNKA